jgi:uncharacterized protein (TIGR02757 family)
MSNHPVKSDLSEHLETLYTRYHRREYVHPDPLEFLYGYPEPGDREIVGMVASALAYGRVVQILKSVRTVLERMGPSPRSFVMSATQKQLQMELRDFRHRFTSGEEMASFLYAIRGVLERYGSLEACMARYFRAQEETVLGALCGFAEELAQRMGNGTTSSLLPLPQRGSACKRLHLFLRWMVRRDEVDPGGWTAFPPSALIVPMDTHMFRIGRALGLISRGRADIRAALEMTDRFRQMVPEDPLRYDFCLTRLGIRRDGDLKGFLAQCTEE